MDVVQRGRLVALGMSSYQILYVVSNSTFLQTVLYLFICDPSIVS